jgi:hypothetical protein
MRKNYIKLLGGILISLFLSTAGYSQEDKKESGVGKKEPNTNQSEESNTNESKDNEEGEKNKKTITIEFDKDGKIISDLPERIERDDSVVTMCNDSLEIKDGLRKQMIDVLSKSYSSLTSRQAKKNLGYLYPLFIEKESVDHETDSTLFSREIETLKNDIKSEIADLLKKTNDVNSTHIPKIDDSTFFLSERFKSDLMKNLKNHKVSFELNVKTFDTICVELDETFES